MIELEDSPIQRRAGIVAELLDTISNQSRRLAALSGSLIPTVQVPRYLGDYDEIDRSVQYALRLVRNEIQQIMQTFDRALDECDAINDLAALDRPDQEYQENPF